MLVLLLAGILLGFILQRMLYAKFWAKGLSVKTEFADKFAFEGEVSKLREEIVNDKLLPLPAVEINMAMNRALVFTGEAKDNANVTDQTYRRDIFALFTRQKVIRTLSFTCRKRGYYELKEVGIIGHDFFFTHSYHGSRAQKTSMYVYPKPIDVRRIAPVCRALSGMILVQNRLYPDPFEFAGIRDYRSSDSMHSINWKASSKGLGLRVNQFDSTTNIKLRLILDTEDTGVLRYEELTEEGIRIAASLAAWLVKEKMDITIVGNLLERMELRSGSAYIQDLYRALSMIDIGKEAPRISELLQSEAQTIGAEEVCVVISRNRDEKTVQAVAELSGVGGSVLWVCPVHPFMLQDEKMPSPKGVQFVVWEVA